MWGPKGPTEAPRRPYVTSILSAGSYGHAVRKLTDGGGWAQLISRAFKIGFGKYIRLEEMGTIGGATGADPRDK
jgi:hypothetical protein